MFTACLILGGLAAALGFWAISGLVQPLPSAIAMVLLALFAFIAILRDFDLISLKLPENRRLIPESLFREHPYRSASQFGFELGTGMRTYVSSTSPYLIAAAVLLLQPGFIEAVLVGVGFGVGRSLMILGRYMSTDRIRWDAALAERVGLLRRTAVTVCAAAVLMLA